MCLVSFPFVGGERSLDPESIIYVQTEGHRNVFFVIEGQEEMQFRIYQRLDEIERVLTVWIYKMSSELFGEYAVCNRSIKLFDDNINRGSVHDSPFKISDGKEVIS